MRTAWDEYLAQSDADEKFSACRQRCRGAFQGQCENIRQLVDKLKPATVACLGAGVLNDIPYAELVAATDELHLVDWLVGSPRAGVGLAIIHRVADAASCLYCRQFTHDPVDYCSSYAPSSTAGLDVCDRFVLADTDPPTCKAFRIGKYPSIHHADVTGGYASKFGRLIPDEIRKAQNWTQAFSRAIRTAEAIEPDHSIPIRGGSVDLVTSSMLVSQFDHEPYNFFSTRAAQRFGKPTGVEQQRLLPRMEQLRAVLMTGQLRGHFDEAARILVPGGALYLSFEMFHAVPESARRFLVAGVPRILEAAAARFEFDYDAITRENTLSEFSTDGSESLVTSFLLRAK